ncbi:class I SAM-dependent methyltransferase [Lusitaniella coriacea LEGE 07157]|uniref:Class I SAM-dependent methyltransferase n=1 Tax=Lusitaniella coriacea LEGE 07157 TaxID=945747 RepID=A0A8J7E203_9CYAN|nr:class I SAM-dependent methyltransferase [Lusitaniella coriacea]MBE9118151.1 class I SAM-dependent methyltransferase [Lusitaniella coriacea LEGE 07157]
MTATTSPGIASRLVNGILAIKPLANFAKTKARTMMIDRAEEMGVPWRKRVKEFGTYEWDSRFQQVCDSQLTYPDYYLTSFHAYDSGNLSWKAAWEVECAAYAVHAKIWPDAGVKGDAQLRQSYHEVMTREIPIQPETVLDLGCGVGMSTFALQDVYRSAKVTGVDLSPYFLSVAQYNSEERNADIAWKHASAEATGLQSGSFDLVSACLMFHELPQEASLQILTEARRLLRPGGYLAIMDMNPRSEVFLKMPPYILTLLKSTEPYLDRYFSLDFSRAIADAGFETPTIAYNSPRHRTIIAKTR